MKFLNLIMLIFFFTHIYAQDNKILVYDMNTKTKSYIEIAPFDTSITQEKTTFSLGNFNKIFAPLKEIPPTENIFPGSRFTLKRQASLDYDITRFPISTSVILLKYNADTLFHVCSGSLISPKHVITACHCVTFNYPPEDKDSIRHESLFVSPVFDNGEKSAYFDCSWVDKIYFFENWQYIRNDIAILELENPIGEETGWLSIGFNENDEELLDGIFYKFSYPARPIFPDEANIYNGDTMYYNYGIADHIEKSGIGIKGASGIPGESGSSLIKIKNRENYTVYGTLNLSTHLNHTRITNLTYYPIKSIINDSQGPSDSNNRIEDGFSVYPNPASDRIIIQSKNGTDIKKITLFDASGRNVGNQIVNTTTVDYDISNLPNGLYFLYIETIAKKIIKKIIKSGH